MWRDKITFPSHGAYLTFMFLEQRLWDRMGEALLLNVYQ